MTTNTEFFLIKDQNGGFFKINYADIYFIKSVGNYLQFVISGDIITTYGSLQALETFLEPDPRFMQTHRSYIVNLELIEHLSTAAITIGKQKIPIGSKFLDELRTNFIQPNLIKLQWALGLIMNILQFT